MFMDMGKVPVVEVFVLDPTKESHKDLTWYCESLTDLLFYNAGVYYKTDRTFRERRDFSDAAYISKVMQTALATVWTRRLVKRWGADSRMVVEAQFEPEQVMGNHDQLRVAFSSREYAAEFKMFWAS